MRKRIFRAWRRSGTRSWRTASPIPRRIIWTWKAPAPSSPPRRAAPWRRTTADGSWACCGHIANASYAVDRDARGLHIGEKLVRDSVAQAKACGFRILQFNAVVATNVHARHLYERVGFNQLGTIPGGFRMKDGHYEDICPYYIEV